MYIHIFFRYINRINIHVILLEINGNESKIDKYLKKYGYKTYIKEDRNKFYIKK